MTERDDAFDRAVASVSEAITLIDKLGEFFQTEHTWLKSGVVEDDALEWQGWTNKVAARLDYLGFVIPELYETVIHLGHALRDTLIVLNQE